MAQRYRGVMNRPMTASVMRAQEEFKLFCTNPEEVDHNLYGKFLGILKDAGVPWKARRLPDSPEDAAHIMNAVVLAIDAYQHYQRDVSAAYSEIEATMAQTRKHSTNQEIDTTKLTNEVNNLTRRFASAQREHAKEMALLREQVGSLKTKFAQSERDLNDANIQVRKLEVALQDEKRHALNLTSKLVAAENPKFSSTRNGSSEPRAARRLSGPPASAGSNIPSPQQQPRLADRLAPPTKPPPESNGRYHAAGAHGPFDPVPRGPGTPPRPVSPDSAHSPPGGDSTDILEHARLQGHGTARSPVPAGTAPSTGEQPAGMCLKARVPRRSEPQHVPATPPAAGDVASDDGSTGGSGRKKKSVMKKFFSKLKMGGSREKMVHATPDTSPLHA